MISATRATTTKRVGNKTMKFCKKCRRFYEDSAQGCEKCRCELTELKDPSTPVYLIGADGFERERIEAALEHNGIPFESRSQRKSPSASAVTGKDNSFHDIRVPYELYRQATDLMIGIGAVKPEGEEEVIVEDESVEYEEPKEMSPAKRTTIRIISAILLIILFCLVIWGADYLLGFVKNLF